MLGALTAHQISFLVILVVAFALLLTERLRNDLVAVLIVVALALTRVLKPSEALAGFGSEPAVAGIFVLSGALYQTGVSDTIGGLIGRLAGSSYMKAGIDRPSSFDARPIVEVGLSLEGRCGKWSHREQSPAPA